MSTANSPIRYGNLVHPTYPPPLDMVARTLSDLASPPVFLICSVTITVVVKGYSQWLSALGYGFLTAITPVLFLMLLLKKGKISDIHLNKRSERMRPLCFTLACSGIATAALLLTQANEILLTFAVTNFLQLVIFTAITVRWKISAHSTAATAFIIYAIALLGPIAIPVILLLPLVGWARIHLRRHTPMQVIAGTLLGTVLWGTLFTTFNR